MINTLKVSALALALLATANVSAQTPEPSQAQIEAVIELIANNPDAALSLLNGAIQSGTVGAAELAQIIATLNANGQSALAGQIANQYGDTLLDGVEPAAGPDEDASGQ